MSTTTLAAPIRVNHSGVHARPGIARLVAVELRKMVNGRFLAESIAGSPPSRSRGSASIRG